MGAKFDLQLKRWALILILFAKVTGTLAQAGGVLYHGKFRKGTILMSSKSYKPDDWEQPYFDSSIKSAFPSDLGKFPDKYRDKLIHLVGVVDSVYSDTKDSVTSITFLLENKFWDYIEDYSIQDEVMFVSERGDGKFLLTTTGIDAEQLDMVKRFPAEKKLFLVYGIYRPSANGLPEIVAQKIKYIDYELYTTKVFAYDIDRDKDGNVKTDKKGKPQVTNFKFMKVASLGQNK